MGDDTERRLLEVLRIEPANARARSNLAVHYHELGRYAEAVEQHRMAMEADAADPQIRFNLATTLHASGRSDEALALLDETLERNPDDPMLHYGRACVLQAMERADDSRDAFLTAVTLQPAQADAWYGLGTLHQAGGDAASALQCYRRVAGLVPDHPAALHMIAALGGEASDAPPPRFVKELFDNYAARYDDHLTRDLLYSAPALVEAALRQALGERGVERACDLGCGTGLFGERLRSLARHRTGVDVSGEMLERARGRNCYDSLVCDDLHGFLRSCRPGAFDLVSAVDVFSYLGALDGAFRGVRRAIRDGGLFAFTVESGEESGDFSLGSSGRYRHAGGYLDRLGRERGFRQVSCTREGIRIERGRPCEGYVIVLKAGTGRTA